MIDFNFCCDLTWSAESDGTSPFEYEIKSNTDELTSISKCFLSSNFMANKSAILIKFQFFSASKEIFLLHFSVHFHRWRNYSEYQMWHDTTRQQKRSLFTKAKFRQPYSFSSLQMAAMQATGSNFNMHNNHWKSLANGLWSRICVVKDDVRDKCVYTIRPYSDISNKYFFSAGCPYFSVFLSFFPFPSIFHVIIKLMAALILHILCSICVNIYDNNNNPSVCNHSAKSIFRIRFWQK